MVLFNTLPAALVEVRSSLIHRLATTVDAVRMKVVQCIGVYSFFDKDYASQLLPLVVQVVIMDRKESVQQTAFRVLMDMLLRFGLSVAGPADQGYQHLSYIGALTKGRLLGMSLRI